jgi:hypothetical protein
MAGYASGTRVSAESTKAELEQLLRKHGCDETGSLTSTDRVTVYFLRQGWQVEIHLKMPTLVDAPASDGSFRTLEQGIESFEEAFAIHLVVGGVHVGQRLLPALREAKRSGSTLPLLAGETTTPVRRGPDNAG